MRTIQLSGKKAAGRVVLVDDEDYGVLSQYTWYVDEQMRPGRKPRGPYAATNLPASSGARRSVRMHKMLTGWSQVDHYDGNGLNNQRSNLRDATGTQNQANRGKPVGATSSQFKGVSWNKNAGKWQATAGTRARGGGHLGYFTDEAAAARAYDVAAIALWGEYAQLNFANLAGAGRVTSYSTNPHAGSDSGRQSVGLPGHCEDCAGRGHVKAHPKLGCADVGCTAIHGDQAGTVAPVLSEEETGRLHAELGQLTEERSRIEERIAELGLTLNRSGEARLRARREGLPQSIADQPGPPPAETTIAPGDDTICARCECPLPAGAPAWPTADGFNCADCAPESTEGEQ